MEFALQLWSSIAVFDFVLKRQFDNKSCEKTHNIMATIIVAFAVLLIEWVLLVITLLKFVKIYMQWGRSNEPALTIGTSILGEVRNVEISRATQQLLCSKSDDFLAVFTLAHSIINQIA
jgi:uncharacterized membrane protein